ncbi:ADIPOR-like receptor [Hibiscus syriacus]|uniref:ADIPOR-like receptor n=1 Tax=Hibiscus syriacus TaxID=106335 RepID=A0A6A3A899_HIBSY|nr:36.4 kDa proline-rich protein-like [Hibiscus syriacus]KAE8700186.1 ADIPOR-like receptor [Hibiscus syriacus]
MESSKISALLLICMLFISSVTPILGCRSCGKAPPKHRRHKGKSPKGPITLPPIVPKLPPVQLPPIVKPPIHLPPVTTKPPSGKGKPRPSPPTKDTCPIDTLKLGACVDLLGGLVHIGLGDPVVNQCCPVLAGLAELEAAVCLCTTLKLKVLNLKLYVPLALQLLVTCGKTPPPGYTCYL